MKPNHWCWNWSQYSFTWDKKLYEDVIERKKLIFLHLNGPTHWEEKNGQIFLKNSSTSFLFQQLITDESPPKNNAGNSSVTHCWTLAVHNTQCKGKVPSLLLWSAMLLQKGNEAQQNFNHWGIPAEREWKREDNRGLEETKKICNELQSLAMKHYYFMSYVSVTALTQMLELFGIVLRGAFEMFWDKAADVDGETGSLLYLSEGSERSPSLLWSHLSSRKKSLKYWQLSSKSY